MLLLRGATRGSPSGVRIQRVSIHAPLARSNFRLEVARFCKKVSIHAPLARSNFIYDLPKRQIFSFNTCSSCEEQLSACNSDVSVHKFQYMLLLRGATRRRSGLLKQCTVSIHAPLARSNRSVLKSSPPFELFQYMLLLRGATGHASRRSSVEGVSIHAPLARSNLSEQSGLLSTSVSIHAPLARSNIELETLAAVARPVSIHAPLARSNNQPCAKHTPRKCFNTCSSCEEQLNLTELSVVIEVSIHAPLARSNHRRATFASAISKFQYMLLLRGATCACAVRGAQPFVSIHAPLARSNSVSSRVSRCSSMFQYMLLLRGATRRARWDSNYINVSIHAPLARSNSIVRRWRGCMEGFNTCSSCEEQLSKRVISACHGMFQYMLLLRGATPNMYISHSLKAGFNTCSSCEEQHLRQNFFLRLVVSIHAPLARSNFPSCTPVKWAFCFNTCSSCEEQRNRRVRKGDISCFNTCSSCEEQQKVNLSTPAISCFNTCSSCEEQLKAEFARDDVTWFQYMLLLRGATIRIRE